MEKFYTPRELSTAGLLVSRPCERTIRNMIRAGRLAAKDFGKGLKHRMWRVSQAAVDAFNQNAIA